LDEAIGASYMAIFGKGEKRRREDVRERKREKK